MKKILKLNNVAGLDISGGKCICSCFGDEYAVNLGVLLEEFEEIFSGKRACANACHGWPYYTCNSHCEDLEDTPEISAEFALID